MRWKEAPCDAHTTHTLHSCSGPLLSREPTMPVPAGGGSDGLLPPMLPLVAAPDVEALPDAALARLAAAAARMLE